MNAVSQLNKQNVQPKPLPSRAVQCIASSIYRHLQNEGCEMRDIISVSTQLLSLAALDLKASKDPESK